MTATMPEHPAVPECPPFDTIDLAAELREVLERHGVPTGSLSISPLWQGDDHTTSLAGVTVRTYTRPEGLPRYSRDEYEERLLSGACQAFADIAERYACDEESGEEETP